MPKPIDTSEDLALKAARFANSTSRHIFLTGKAGTGKTTFLQTLANSTHKSHLIVAPTGIAALNAGGVTIHSQFLLPLGTFVPGAGIPADSPGRFYDAKFLVTRQPLNSIRKQVLREIELLIIDEVSMLRADVLDAVDQRLRSARRRMREPFGGVQLLLIGDLFQLPPIVKDYEWSVLSKHYPTPHFFSSEALNKAGFVYIELNKVFRQSDDSFINILNNLRNNSCTQADIDALNKRYLDAKEYPENTVTLTTHNNQANAINRQSLDELDEKTFKYPATVSGDFPENIYPLPETLELKVGAQIMFVKNDTNGNRFYNGKLAKVISLKDDLIRVKMSGEDREMNLETMEWSNIKYTLNSDKQLEEDIVGTFEQFPIKLAWAITVHKSQGLTFDRAIIDVGRAFAPGQIYVALSRLRSLDGLYLRTRISNSAVQNDTDVLDFQKAKDEQGNLDEILRKAQADFLEESLHQTFNFEPIRDQIAYVERKAGMKMEFTDADMRDALPNLKSNIQSEKENSRIFRAQISQLLRDGNYDLLKERVTKASDYYLNFLFDLLYQTMLHREESAQFARTKTYVKAIDEVDQIIMRAIADIQKASNLTVAVISDKPIELKEEDRRKRNAKREAFLHKISAHIEANPRKGAGKTGRKRKTTGGAAKKGATYEETYRMIKEGNSIHQIAVKRSMAESTIEGHVAKGIAAGKVDIETFVPEDERIEIAKAFEEADDTGLSGVYAAFKGKHSYGKLRMVQAFLSLHEKAETRE